MLYYIPLFAAAPPSSIGCGTGCIAGIIVAIVVVLLLIVVIVIAIVTVCESAKRSKFSVDNKNSTKESTPVEMTDFKYSAKV